MKKSLLEIYALAVCFLAMNCFAVALGIGAYDLLEMSNPNLTLNSHSYQQHQTNEAFKRRGWSNDKEKLPEEEITEMREKSYKVELEAERRDAVQSFIRVLIVMLINIGIFLIHWKVAKRARETNAR
jgi:hypothetical protein